ncbi:MAG: hypothetical protein N4J56_002789 [Chroococcidiopsis sp. SAG 2025]|uniref:condensation domain-containing protein n=1 Tax=Chroococcidiopsis sp. SAG 2025 TaxID=171389 RepID=UPI002936ED05|nr:condensation domain-containing protein [Chroococcidiopsis sp. SAG 2025]MDV2993135.1 hypothetical protein [Chroococcidiopsis sp. SAG 2025]
MTEIISQKLNSQAHVDKLQSLSPERKALLAQLIREKKVGVKQERQPQRAVFNLPTITAAPDERFQPFPLTGLQQAYWVGRSGEVEMGQVASHSYVELEGNFDLERLTQAWQRLIDRHDMMRAIVLPDGTQQVLENLPPYQFRMLDLRGQSVETVNAQLQDVRDRMSHQILPSHKYPLFDIQATLLDDGRTRIHVSLDALIFDGWSIAITYKEWATLYHNPETQLVGL